MRHNRLPNSDRSGMTLMEVVIAIGVVAFVVPLIFAATTSAGNSRRNAEADTRSAWLARHAQRQIIAAWAQPPVESDIETPFPFPEAAAAASPPVVLLYDREGEFVSEGGEVDEDSPSRVPNAAYVVTVTAETQDGPIALVSITVSHPAKSAPANRGTYRYKFLSTRQGTL